jgi:cellulose synthase/poly-beta-1,6-N-acetylglucosamine synthase-like glycosyltransferase
LILLAQFLFVTLAALVLIQLALVLRFFWLLSGKPMPIVDKALPATVVLCVRGNDPTLVECLDSIFAQDAQSFQLLVVADQIDDPGCNTVRAAFDRHRDASIDAQLIFLPEIHDHASLKCQALVHAIKNCDANSEIVALIDADTSAHPTWLRELSSAFEDPQVGAATGFRWYVPVSAGSGSMMRSIWNGAAIVQMQAYKIAWGGTLAFRKSVFDDGSLLERWSRAFCEDTMTQRMLQKQNLRLTHVPSLVMSSRESTSATSFVNWVQRQLLTSRLYHPSFALTAAHCFSTTLAPLLALVLLIVSLIQQDWPAAIWFAVSIVCYESAALVMLVLIEMAVRRASGDRAERLCWPIFRTLPQYVLSLFATQFCYAWAMVRVLVQRRYAWRGIEYSIAGPQSIQMQGYQPFSESAASTSDSL